MILQTYNLTRNYPGGGGVVGVELEIAPGDFLLLSGPTGAGKSTLIKLIALRERPDKGYILLDGVSSDDLWLIDYYSWRRKLGVIPQDLLLMPDLSVYRNLQLTLRGMGLTARISKRAALKTLARVGLSHRLREKVRSLSGGEARRTAVARALCNEPFLLLADEPLGDLDPQTAEEIMTLFEKINSMGTAVLMVTHRGDIRPKINHREIRMERGRLVR